MLAHSNAAAAADALSQLLPVCLNSKQSHLSALLADVICAVQAEAPEAAISMLAAVAGYAVTNSQAASHVAAKSLKDQKADQVHLQASAMTVMVEYASRGPDEKTLVLELFFDKVRAP